jgi:hypothetical protein
MNISLPHFQLPQMIQVKASATSWLVLRPLIASMATLALNSELWGGACSMVGALFRGGTPPQRLTMGPVQKNQTSSQSGRLHVRAGRAIEFAGDALAALAVNLLGFLLVP